MAELEKGCCSPESQASCCEPSEKAACCGAQHDEGCGCEPSTVVPADIREAVREKYAAHVRSTSGAGCSGAGWSPADREGAFGAALYEGERDAASNAADAGITNAEFVKGYLEELPRPDASVDVVISNCVINLSGDRPSALREAARVLRSGGRFAVSDVIADRAWMRQPRRTCGSGPAV